MHLLLSFNIHIFCTGKYIVKSVVQVFCVDKHSGIKCMGVRVITLCILNLCNKWRGAFSFAPHPSYPKGHCPVCNV